MYLAVMIEEMSPTMPQLEDKKPSDFVDSSLIREIEAEGFFDRLKLLLGNSAVHHHFSLKAVLLNLQVIACLEIEPKTAGSSKVTCQPERRIG
jgi:hypothetical protein